MWSNTIKNMFAAHDYFKLCTLVFVVTVHSAWGGVDRGVALEASQEKTNHMLNPSSTFASTNIDTNNVMKKKLPDPTNIDSSDVLKISQQSSFAEEINDSSNSQTVSNNNDEISQKTVVDQQGKNSSKSSNQIPLEFTSTKKHKITSKLGINAVNAVNAEPSKQLQITSRAMRESQGQSKDKNKRKVFLNVKQCQGQNTGESLLQNATAAKGTRKEKRDAGKEIVKRFISRIENSSTKHQLHYANTTTDDVTSNKTAGNNTRVTYKENEELWASSLRGDLKRIKKLYKIKFIGFCVSWSVLGLSMGLHFCWTDNQTVKAVIGAGLIVTHVIIAFLMLIQKNIIASMSDIMSTHNTA